MRAPPGARALPAWARSILVAAAALALFALVLLVVGKDPLRVYADTLAYTFGNAYGLSELVVRMIPLLLTAVAVAFPSRAGLINVGGEGQLLMGAWLASAGALSFPALPAWLLLPTMTILGFAGGALWALIPALLRARKLVNETISTLLLNYLAPLVIGWFIFGPWRGAESSSYPQSPEFVAAARLPSFLGTRIHLGLFFGLACLLVHWLVYRRTRWGLQLRAIGGNPEAAERLGIPVALVTVIALGAGGGAAGLAGMAEVSAIHGRLRQGISPGYGFSGFLIAWLSGGDPVGILLMTFLFAIVMSAGDIMQITQGLPYAAVNILMAVALFIVLSSRQRGRAKP